MKLEEAIKIVAQEPITCKPGRKAELEPALNLLIEAGKGIQSCRQYPECPFTELLPGET